MAVGAHDFQSEEGRRLDRHAAAPHAPGTQNRHRALAVAPTARPAEAWPAHLAAEGAKRRGVIHPRAARAR